MVLIGASGSGKSTWAGEYLSSSQVVASDGLRAMVGAVGDLVKLFARFAERDAVQSIVAIPEVSPERPTAAFVGVIGALGPA